MHLHILGICGTFMGGLALLARELGHRVTGSDTHVYPPMSEQLAAAGIRIAGDYAPAHLEPPPDCVVVGNALSRGNPALEYVLDRGLPYTSGPAWLAEHVLQGRQVAAVAGTHGKTTTTSILAWLLEAAGLAPGFLVGGVPGNFGVSARLGRGPFVVEADEYDTAFFDKRAKFVHYRPRTLVLTNLEYDHADIYPDLASIERQFHHLIRTVPGTGRILSRAGDEALERVLAMGCWTPVVRFGAAGAEWHAEPTRPDASAFEVRRAGRREGAVTWRLIGAHNLQNALAALAAAEHLGVPPADACEHLGRFRNVRRRLEVRAQVNGVTVYDDFAHHPTAIAATLAALRRRAGEARILAALEPRSNTMRLGVHRETLGPALAEADRIWLYRPAGLEWDAAAALACLGARARVCNTLEAIIDDVLAAAKPGDQVVIMSNGAFGGIHEKLIAALERAHA